MDYNQEYIDLLKRSLRIRLLKAASGCRIRREGQILAESFEAGKQRGHGIHSEVDILLNKTSRVEGKGNPSSLLSMPIP